MMLRWSVPAEKGNQAVADGSFWQTIDSLLQEIEPEAAYFGPIDGKRAGMIFFDMADPSEMPRFGERLRKNLDASVEFVPIMNADDLRKGLEKANV